MNKKKIIIIAVVAIVLLLVLGALAFFFLVPKGDEEEKEVEIVYAEFPLDVQYTNIKTLEGQENARKRILKYSPVIKYVQDEETLAALTANKTDIVNEIRKYFMNRSEEQLANLERVQEDVTDVVIETLEIDPDKIDDVLFIEFIIQ